MKLVESILTKNPCYAAGRKITVKGLMLHSIGCPQPSAEVLVKNWNRADHGVCVHAFVDGNTGTVYQTLPWNQRASHGGGSSNNTHIGVEMCEPGCIKYTNGAVFTCSDVRTAKAVAQRTYEAAVELFAMLCKKYSLNPLTDGVIVSHAEGYKRGIASNHGDPEHLWKQLGMGYTMDTFREAVKAAMGKTVAVETAPAKAETSKGESTVNIELAVLRYGDKGEQVKALQRMLYAMGYDLGNSKIDGDFGKKTCTAVKAYQTKNKLEADGVVGKNTWSKLLKG